MFKVNCNCVLKQGRKEGRKEVREGEGGKVGGRKI
jgi:hypothetical protein